MMFLIRSAFWLVLLILLIPTDGEQQKKMYEMAQTAVADVSGFCVRNPQTCDSGQYAINVLVQKAQYGAHMVQSLVNGQTGPFALAQDTESTHRASAQMAGTGQPAPTETPAAGAMMPLPSAVPIEPTPWVQGDSQNTLNPEDLRTEWSAPNV